VCSQTLQIKKKEKRKKKIKKSFQKLSFFDFCYFAKGQGQLNFRCFSIHLFGGIGSLVGW
jgi:hypothetical protein